MAYNELGKYSPRNLSNWSKGAIECFKNRFNCNICTLPEDIKEQCQMKANVLELYKKFGKPKERIFEMQLSKSEIDELRRCAKRELNKRLDFYPKWIASGKMTQQKADYEIQCMQRIYDYFSYLQIHTAPEQQTLF